MATNVIEILIRAKNEAAGTFRRLREEMARLQGNASDASNVLGDIQSNFTGLDEGASSAASSITGLYDGMQSLTEVIPNVVSGVQTLTRALIAWQGIRIARDLAETAARADVLATVLGVVGSNAGISSADLRQMDLDVQKLGITAQSSRDSLTKLIQSGLVNSQTAYKATQLARAAQDLAVTAGADSSETFQRMVTNIQQLDVQGLRWQGLVVARQQGEVEFARSIGKTVQELTREEQQQAFLNATLKAAAGLSGAYTQAMADAGKQLQSLNRYTLEFKTALGVQLQPAFLAIIEEVTSFYKEATKIVKGFNEVDDAAVVFGNSVRAVAENIKELLLTLVRLSDVLVPLLGVWLGVKLFSSISVIAKVFGVAKVSTNTFAAEIEKLNQQLAKTPIAAQAASASVNNLKQSMSAPTQKFSRDAFVSEKDRSGPVPIQKDLFAPPPVPMQGDLFGGAGKKAAEALPKAGEIAKLEKESISAITRLRGAFAVLGTTVRLVGLAVSSAFALITTAISAYQLGTFLYNESETVREAANLIIASMDLVWKVFTAPAKFVMTYMEAFWGGLKGLFTNGIKGAIEGFTAPWEDWASKIQFTLSEIKESWKNLFKSDEQAKVDQEINDRTEGMRLLKESIELEKKLAAAKAEADKYRAKSGGNQGLLYKVELEAAEDAVAEIEEQQKKGADALGKIYRRNGEEFKSYLRGYANDLKLPSEIAQKEIDDVNKSVQDADKTLGLDKRSSGDYGISAEFIKVANAATLLADINLKPFERNIGGNLQRVEVSIARVKAGFSEFYSKIKSPEEMDLFIRTIDKLDPKMKFLIQELKDLSMNAKVRFEATVAKDLEEQLSGLISRLNELKGVYQIVTEVQTQNQNSTRAFTETLVSFGVPLDQAKKGIIDLNQSFASIKDTSKTLASLSLSALVEEQKKLGKAYQENVTQIDLVATKERELAEVTYTNTETARNAMVAVDKATATKRLEVAREYYKQLGQLQQEAHNLYKASMQKLVDIDKELFALKQEQKDFMQELNRQEMTAEEQFYDRESELIELADQAKRAAALGEIERAKEINQKRLALAKELASAEGEDPYEARRKGAIYFNETVRDQEALLKKQRDETKQAAEEQLAMYNSLTEAVTKLGKEINDAAEVKKLQIIADLDDDSAKAVNKKLNEIAKPRKAIIETSVDGKAIQNSIQKIKDGISSTQFVINARLETQKSAVLADGGYVRGPGTETSDSIPARLSDGEFVVKAKAVRTYGVSFLHMLNSMRLPTIPKFSVGGLVSSAMERVTRPMYDMVPRFATGGLVSAPSAATQGTKDVVDINLNMGGKKVSLMAERQQARAFVDLLNAVEAVR